MTDTTDVLRPRLDRIENGTSSVGVGGLGYAGVPLAVEVAEAGLTAMGYDVSGPVVEAVNRGERPIGDGSATALVLAA